MNPIDQQNWDKVYATGDKYQQAPPLAFVSDILEQLKIHHLTNSQGLYIGCGNGRNYLPLVNHGLNLTGLDISQIALDQLAAKNPSARLNLVHADFLSYRPDTTFDFMVAIQVFQHGNWQQIEQLFAKVDSLLNPGGLFCLRVRSTQMPIKDPYQQIEQTEQGGFTVKFTEGKKKNQLIHYYTALELGQLTRSQYTAVASPNLINEQDNQGKITKSHIQAIWQKQASAKQ